MPLIVQDRVVGVMDLESDRVGYFTDDHVRTLSLLAPQVASSVENARLYQEMATRERRMEEDLKAARELQRVLLPDAEPEIEGPRDGGAAAAGARNLRRHLRLFRAPRRADRDRVRRRERQRRGGGALWRADERPAAHAGAAPAQSRRADEGAQRSADRAQGGSALRDAAGAAVGPATRQIVMANAGALPPMICRAAEILKLRVEGVPLGLLESREYEEVTFQARAGDVVLYSDGITDHLNAAGSEYGRGRLAHVVRSALPRIGRWIDRRHLQRSGQVLHHAFDDQTLFAMQVK